MSVVIPVYNRASFIGKAIASVLEQAQPGDEVLVVDDGSIDDTVRVVREFGDRVRLIEQPNAGAGAARNAGVAAARHPLIAFLDSDDRWLPGKLDLQRRFMAMCPDVVMCFAQYMRQRDEGPEMPVHMDWEPAKLGHRKTVQIGSESVPYHVGDAYLLFLKLGPFIQINTVLMRRAAIPHGPFAQDVRIFEEEEAFARMARQGPVAFLDRRVSVLRSHAGPRLTNVRGTAEAHTAWLTVVQRVWGEDAVFFGSHRTTYNKIHARCLHQRGRALLDEGQAELAREDFRRAGRFRFSARVASLLPDRALSLMLSSRDAWKHGRRSPAETPDRPRRESQTNQNPTR